MEINDNKFDESMGRILALLEELRKLLKAKNRLNGENLLDNQDLCFLLNQLLWEQLHEETTLLLQNFCHL